MNVVTYNHGEFIRIGDLRVRKQLIYSYNVCEMAHRENGDYAAFVVVFYHGNPSGMSIKAETMEIAKIMVEKLDWIFMKDGEFKGEQTGTPTQQG